MDYRLYRPEDFESLYAIEQVCFQPPFRFGRAHVQQLVSAPNGATWIAQEEDGNMTGFSIVQWMRQARGASAYIDTIEVLPQYRGRGAGSELLRRVEGSAGDAGAATMWLHVDPANRSAIRLYEAHGYLYYDREEHFYAPGREALIYRKLLAGESTEPGSPT